MKKYNFLFILLIFFSVPCLCVENAITTSESAALFSKPDFDSDIIEELPPGTPLQVSKEKAGPFFKVQLSNGSWGYLADSEFQFKNKTLQKKSPPKTPQEKSKVNQKIKTENKKKHPFALTAYRGLSFSWIRFREDTMALKPTSNSYFVGYKLLGPGLIFDGAMVTEWNMMLKPSAPEYYEQATGVAASGWILETDLLLETAFTQSQNVITFLGLGPMFKYSKFDVGLRNSTNGRVNYYSLEDMTLGVCANVGFGLKWGSVALRGEYKYFWEKMQYWGLGTSLVFEF